MKIVITKTFELELDPKHAFEEGEAPESPTTEQAIEEIRAWTTEIGYDDPAAGFLMEWGLEDRAEEKSTIITIDGKVFDGS